MNHEQSHLYNINRFVCEQFVHITHWSSLSIFKKTHAKIKV